MSIAPTTNTWPTVFVTGPIPQQEAPPIPGSNYGLAYHLIKALNKNPSPEVLANFLVKNPDFYLDSAGKRGWTAMAVAIEKQAIPLIQAILDRDPTLARKNYIVYAAWTGSVEMANIFLQYAANVNQCPSGTLIMDGVTPLHNSIDRGDDPLTKFFLLRGGVVYEQARERLLVKKDDDLVDSSWEERTTNQPIYVDRMIKEIKREYKSSGPGLARSLHTPKIQSIFSRLSLDVRYLVARFASPETELRHRFLVRLNLMRD